MYTCHRGTEQCQISTSYNVDNSVHTADALGGSRYLKVESINGFDYTSPSVSQIILDKLVRKGSKPEMS